MTDASLNRAAIVNPRRHRVPFTRTMRRGKLERIALPCPCVPGGRGNHPFARPFARDRRADFILGHRSPDSLDHADSVFRSASHSFSSLVLLATSSRNCRHFLPLPSSRSELLIRGFLFIVELYGLFCLPWCRIVSCGWIRMPCAVAVVAYDCLGISFFLSLLRSRCCHMGDFKLRHRGS